MIVLASRGGTLIFGIDTTGKSWRDTGFRCSHCQYATEDHWLPVLILLVVCGGGTLVLGIYRASPIFTVLLLLVSHAGEMAFSTDTTSGTS